MKGERLILNPYYLFTGRKIHSACEGVHLRVLFIVLLAILPLILPAQPDFKEWSQVDIIGNAKYSLYNFTDAVIPYYGVDSWAEVKSTIWMNKGKTLAPYISMLGSNMTYLPREQDKEIKKQFSWQRFLQVGAGLQWYPFYQHGEDYSPEFGIRVFAYAGKRFYTRHAIGSAYSDLVDNDLHLGADYYHDNIFDKEQKTVVITWANLTWRRTNFNFSDFKNGVLSGNFKLGRKWGNMNRSLLLSYLVFDTNVVPLCRECKWWENYIHPGVGTSWYPFAFDRDGEPNAEVFRRIHLFAEFFGAGFWLKGQPPERVKEFDFRFGVGFSTPGFNRSKNETAQGW